MDRCARRCGRSAGVATSTTADADGADAPRVTVVPATLAKGLEYDHVVVVEPAEIVEAETRGLNRLYVVLTRAVSRLDVLHPVPCRPRSSRRSKRVPPERDARLRGRVVSPRRAIGQAGGDTARPMVPAAWRMIGQTDEGGLILGSGRPADDRAGRWRRPDP